MVGSVSRHDGRIVWITGAGSGIGLATAYRLLDQGASVIATDINADSLVWTEDHSRAEAVPGDVTDEAVNKAAVEAAGKRFGGLDAAVLNAGVSQRGDLATLPMEQFDRTLDVNVRAVVLGIRACIEPMRNRGGGAIAVTSSTSGLGGDPGRWAYNTSKAAVLNLVRAAALDLGPLGIRVNAVCPGPTETGMSERILEDPEAYESLRRRSALQRWAQPDEVAAVFDFLVSPDASIVTGAVVAADGGITANTGQFLPEPTP
jgi:3-oxoacyl-[acyl-carrier protein] reductase